MNKVLLRYGSSHLALVVVRLQAMPRQMAVLQAHTAAAGMPELTLVKKGNVRMVISALCSQELPPTYLIKGEPTEDCLTEMTSNLIQKDVFVNRVRSRAKSISWEFPEALMGRSLMLWY